MLFFFRLCLSPVTSGCMVSEWPVGAVLEKYINVRARGRVFISTGVKSVFIVPSDLLHNMFNTMDMNAIRPMDRTMKNTAADPNGIHCGEKRVLFCNRRP